MRLALYQPEIPQNLGTLLRLGACLSVPLDIIDPCSFPLSDSRLRRAGMDYLERASLTRHKDWEDFLKSTRSRRIILFTPHASRSFLDFVFEKKDTLLLGRESTGIPADIAEQLEIHLKIPMLPDRRSMNIALAGAMALREAFRQTNLFPTP